MTEHMKSCYQRTLVKVDYGASPNSNLELIEEDMLPESLYDPK